jgi:hypothetical protein
MEKIGTNNKLIFQQNKKVSCGFRNPYIYVQATLRNFLVIALAAFRNIAEIAKCIYRSNFNNFRK